MWGCFDAWGVDLSYGFGPALLGFTVQTLTNVIAAFSIAEMISAFPSAGGLVGFARISLGHWGSFLCGTTECLYLGLSVTFGTLLWGNYIVDAYELTDPAYLVLFSALMYVMSFSVITVGGRFMWNFFVVTASMSAVIILLYFISAFKYGDFLHNAFNTNGLPSDDFNSGPVISEGRRLLSTFAPTGMPTAMPTAFPARRWFAGGWMGIFSALPTVYWTIAGNEVSCVAGEEIHDPTANVPRGLIAGALYAYFITICMFFAGVSLPAGTAGLPLSLHPIVDGVRLLFPSTSIVTITGICSVGALATVTTWFYAFSRQLFSLSRKGFLPGFLAYVANGTPLASLLFGLLIGFTIVIIINISGNYEFTTIVLVLLQISAMFTDVCLFAAYVGMKVRHPKMERPFKSPFGLIGGIYGLILASFCVACSIITQLNKIVYIGSLLGGCIVLWSGYYFFVSRHNLEFDEDEKKAVIESITVSSLLKTEHGLDYLELYMKKEMNSETLICLLVLLFDTTSKLA